MKKDKYTLLLVDDEEYILRILQRVLGEEKRFEIITATSGQEALEKIPPNGIDMVISDQRMPGMSGIELLTQIKQRYPDSIRILLSGFTDIDVLIGAINEGEVCRFISKPWKNEELKKIIYTTLEQREEIAIVREVIAKMRQAIDRANHLTFESYQEGNNVCMRVNAEGSLISGEALSEILTLFLKTVFEKTYDKEVDLELQLMGGVIAKQKGKVTLTIDIGKGINLIIELPELPARIDP
ncbi:MAG: response regulator [Syntrophaceae bacterium]|nr:response regulator [Syntrophaceae bacterium]